MQIRRRWRVAGLVPAFAIFAAFAGTAGAVGPVNASTADNLPHPLAEQQDALHQRGLEAKLDGEVFGNVAKVGNHYVELARESTDRVFVVVADFGTQIHPTYGGTPGPGKNEIAQPDRAVDNNTIWQADYNKAHYEHMYFTRMREYFETQSSGRYSIEGEVTEWVRVPYNEARYGKDLCGSNVCANTWFLIRDAIDIWVADQLAAGKTLAEVTAYLQTFDVQDRYDYDIDGDFDEPDGYIDHFQIVHAGEDAAAGGGAQGQDAIWSHRWYAFYTNQDVTGPPGNLRGGVEIGGGSVDSPANPTGVWVGDYTIQPENGGLGVFAHEFSHDLGLPDAYDTSGGENSTGFWTLMSSGSYLGDGSTDGIGTTPNDLSGWDKIQLGWSNYAIAPAGRKTPFLLGPAEYNTVHPQAVVVNLGEQDVTTDVNPVDSGTYSWWSGMGDDLENSMSKAVTLGPAPNVISFRTWYDIEEDFDYAFVEVSDDGGASFTTLHTEDSDPAANEGITGVSGAWKTLTAAIPDSMADKTVILRFRYLTDGGVAQKGFMVDQIAINGTVIEDAEAGDNGWALIGFLRITGSVTNTYPHYYIAENKGYRSYDETLETGPYNFGFLNTLPEWVEHFPYQDGLLIWYWDASQPDNNTSAHPGKGEALPVDAHPAPLYRPDGAVWRARVLAYDSTFGMDDTDAVTLHINGEPSSFGGLPPTPFFDDRLSWWSAETPLAGVDVPKTGTQIQTNGAKRNSPWMKVKVKAPAIP